MPYALCLMHVGYLMLLRKAIIPDSLQRVGQVVVASRQIIKLAHGRLPSESQSGAETRFPLLPALNPDPPELY